jgi:hypothetical protein
MKHNKVNKISNFLSNSINLCYLGITMNENCVVGHSDIVVRGFLSVIKDIITDRKGQKKGECRAGILRLTYATRAGQYFCWLAQCRKTYQFCNWREKHLYSVRDTTRIKRAEMAAINLSFTS